jgi:hypothetical protein
MAQEVTVQCLRCLYKIDVSMPNTPCVEHNTAERKPTTLQVRPQPTPQRSCSADKLMDRLGHDD